MPLMKQIAKCGVLFFVYTISHLQAQEITPKWTPEEKKELFGYCDKPDLIKQLKFSPEMADKVGEIDFWATVQQISITANTNEVYATFGELDKEVIKKYKAIKLSDDQLKALLDFKQDRMKNTKSCAIITLTPNHIFDTLTQPKAIQLYKTKIRKPLIDKTAINGRQADMLFEIEIWKQKEALTIALLPLSDFNRIRKTVAMYEERARRFRVVGLAGEQLEGAIEYFDQHPL